MVARAWRRCSVPMGSSTCSPWSVDTSLLSWLPVRSWASASWTPGTRPLLSSLLMPWRDCQVHLPTSFPFFDFLVFRSVKSSSQLKLCSPDAGCMALVTHACIDNSGGPVESRLTSRNKLRFSFSFACKVRTRHAQLCH